MKPLILLFLIVVNIGILNSQEAMIRSHRYLSFNQFKVFVDITLRDTTIVTNQMIAKTFCDLNNYESCSSSLDTLTFEKVTCEIQTLNK